MGEIRNRAIVTGATGFIGSALCRELLTHGYEVVAIIRPGSKNIGRLEALTQQHSDSQTLRLLECPLEQLPTLKDRVEHEFKADLFYHLAWHGSSGKDREHFDLQYGNIRYTVSGIRLAKACGCRRFIGAGSQAEYGIVHGKAKENKTVPNPFMMYGAAKLAAFQMGRLVANQENISFVWPRIYSVYGPGENGDTLISYLIDALQNGETPQVTKGENLWDFTYIEDCVRMLRLLGEAPEAEGIYNLSAGTPKPLKDFILQLRDVVSPESGIAFGARNADHNRTFWLDPDVNRIQAISGRCHTSFAEGIRRKLELLEN
ncbi:MAG: NAD(P)-dependent oxidoreductase [Firmicutes bacterium]|jgi:UDP-glucose 4-epimerase|nr:NAD(P)-dependent oxidoreductase [Bacillota bacterium]